jgi:hypothetical protein
VSLIAILLPLKISQEQGVREETQNNGGFETEHQGRRCSNSSHHAATSGAKLRKRLADCVDNKRRYLTDTIFRK